MTTITLLFCIVWSQTVLVESNFIMCCYFCTWNWTIKLLVASIYTIIENKLFPHIFDLVFHNRHSIRIIDCCLTSREKYYNYIHIIASFRVEITLVIFHNCLFRGLGLWCLTSLSTMFQLYCGVSFIGGGNRSTRRKPPT
jgi:hypothetical protein